MRAELLCLYRDPRQPGSLGGVSWFAEANGVSLKQGQNVLRQDLGYELHKPLPCRFPTLPVLVFEPDEQWAADLIDVQKLAKWNHGVKYLLRVVGVFSKFAWVQPVKNKQGKIVAGALAKILSGKRHPQKLQTDDGKEFYKSFVKKVCEVGKIRHFSTAGDTKASVVERFIRTLKQRMYRYMTTSNTMAYLPALQHLVVGYNATFHRSIGMAPIKVNAENTLTAWKKLYEKKLTDKKRKSRLKVGDKVPLNTKQSVRKRVYTWLDGGSVLCEVGGTRSRTFLQDYRVGQYTYKRHVLRRRPSEGHSRQGRFLSRGVCH